MKTIQLLGFDKTNIYVLTKSFHRVKKSRIIV